MFIGEAVETFHNVADERDQVNLLHPHLHLLVLYLAEVQNLIDKPQHPVRVSLHQHQLFPFLIIQLAMLQDLLYGTGNQRQRCTQFVRYICEET